MQNINWSAHDEKNMPFFNGMLYRIDLYEKGSQLETMPNQTYSVKRSEKDHLGRQVDVLWMLKKDSNYDSVNQKNVIGLMLNEARDLLAYEQLSDEVIMEHLSQSLFSMDYRTLPVETLLHAFLPFKHIDYTYPASLVSMACASNGREICEALWGDSFIWIDDTIPGFGQSRALAKAIENFPNKRLAIIANNGLVTWGETSRECYENTLSIVQQADDFISSKNHQDRNTFNTNADDVDTNKKREEYTTSILPWLRGVLSQHSTKILRVDDSEEVMTFVDSKQAEKISQIRALTPAQIEYTKPFPLFVNWDPDTGVENLKTILAEKIEDYQIRYKEHFNSFAEEGEVMRDSLPTIILISGLGMIASGGNAQQADNARRAYRHTIRIIKNSFAFNDFSPLTKRETFDVEYRSRKFHKLNADPVPAEFAGKVIVITGAASGIGRSTAARLASAGGHVAILDLNLEGGQEVAAQINQEYGPHVAVAYKCDVGDEEMVQDVFKKIIYQFGGIDIVVNNAGIAYGAPIEQTSIKDWNLVQKVLTTGYFLISREAFRVWREQDIGGVMVFVGSKNSIRAGKNIVAYSAAKAAELHMARCLAEEGGEAGIRVNSVLPDAVLKGASIFTDELREARAKSYGIEPDQLEDYYIQRTTLKVAVYPEHIAEAIAFLASERSSRTTGGVITVDGGVSTAYVR